MQRQDWNIAENPLLSLYNAEAEQCLLGAIFVNNNAYEHVADLLSPEDFGTPLHGQIYAAIANMIPNGIAANPVTVARALDEPDKAYLAKIVMSAVTVINAPHYAQIIADMARRRDIVTAAQDIIADAAVVDIERPADVVLDEAEDRLHSIAERADRKCGLTSLGQILSDSVGAIEAAYKAGGTVTVNTGLADLDKLLSGMGAGDLVVLAARPSMGKSALAGSIAVNVAGQGKRVLIFSLEMTKAELAARWIAGKTGITTDQQRHGQVDDWGRLIEAQRALSQLPVSVDDGSRLSVPMMRQRARRLKRRMRGLDLVIIDHLQLVRQGGRQESRRLEIGDATSMLKAVAKELGVPVLVLSQLSRAPEQRNDKRPMLSDLRESGDIEQDADVVMFLYRDEYYLERNEPKRRPNQTNEAFAADVAEWEDQMRQAKGLAEIAVAKNRHGRTGTVKVRFDAERQRFENLARGW